MINIHNKFSTIIGLALMVIVPCVGVAHEDCPKSKLNFEEINTNVVSLFKDEISKMGIEFHLQNQWHSNMKNAAALKLSNFWSIQMNGGIYKSSLVTTDAQALATCHELGHLIGGAPYKSNNAGSKMSTEAQADFWATAVCFKKYAKAFPRTQKIVDLNIKNLCESHYQSNPLSNVNDCYRSMLASISLSNFFADLQKESLPNFLKSSPLKVSKTFVDHPNAQCRLDTFKAGVLCEIDEVISTNEKNDLQEMNCQVNNSKINKRPACWFTDRS